MQLSIIQFLSPPDSLQQSKMESKPLIQIQSTEEVKNDSGKGLRDHKNQILVRVSLKRESPSK